MAIRYAYLAELLEREKLTVPELACLTPRPEPYATLMIQPAGAVNANNQHIGPANQAVATTKFKAFLDYSIANATELTLAPEYSCPWLALQETLSADKFPPPGALWALGCEAITPEKLRTFISSTPGIKWIHEPIPASRKNFLDALCYLFETKSQDGHPVKVGILQFKTQHMAGNTLERDHLIPGTTIYILQGEPDFIRFMSIICSEALQFRPAPGKAPSFHLHPFIIFHPQLNTEPRHTGIRRYREDLLGEQSVRGVEIIALNWAKGFSFDPNPKPESHYGGSTLFMKSPKFSLDDVRLNANHEKGLYYSFWEAHQTNLSTLNYNEHVFEFTTQKILTTGSPTLASRDGPEMVSLLTWDPPTSKWIESQSGNDGFIDLCSTYDEPGCDFCTAGPHTPLDRERLLTLCAGTLKPSKAWYRPHELKSFAALADETPMRLVFAQEPKEISINSRKDHLGRFIELNQHIIRTRALFPPNLGDLHGDCRLEPPTASTNFRFNLISISGKVQSATAIYLAVQPPESAKAVFDQIAAEWGTENARRLAVWFEHRGETKSISAPTPEVTDDSDGPTSYTRME